jgi:muconolactone D-isomerase
MEFLVTITVHLPPDLPDPEERRLLAAEAGRARELSVEGTLLRLWRIPGRRSNYGLWSAPDATALHSALTSLPLWPYLEAAVEPLAVHPNDPGAGS